MKKWLIGFLAVVLTLLVGCAAAAEAGFQRSGDWCFRILEEGTAEILYYWSFYDDAELHIPDELDGATVSQIDSNFFRFSHVTAFTVSPTHPYFEVVDGVLFSKADKRLIAYPSHKEAAAYAIPEGTKIIGEDAFSHCENLTSITIPDSVREIRDSAFAFCTALTSICIPNSVTSISDSMFFDCVALTSVTLPDSVTSIGFQVFSYCCNLTSLKIPDSVTSIGSQVFSYCYNLTSLKIPDSVTSIDANPFYGCDQLVLSLSPDHPTLKVVDGVLFSKPDNRLIYYPNIKKESYVVPEGTQTIGAFAFTECDALTHVTLPDSVTSIECDAFWDCPALTSINIPEGITAIEDDTFGYCISLTNISLPQSLTSIGYWAFSSCYALTRLTIPDSVTSIDDEAFDCCSDLLLIVGRNTYAAQYAEENGIPCAFLASDN